MALLEFARAECDRRAAVLRSRNALALDEVLEQGKPLPFPFLSIQIDEIAEMTQQDGALPEEKEMMKRCIALLRSIASIGRSSGVFITVMTQVGNVEIIPSKIRSNAEVRLASRLESGAQSKSFLGATGAENIDEPGVFILSTGKGLFKLRVPFVTNAEHQAQIKTAITKFGKPDYREYERYLDRVEIGKSSDKPLSRFGENEKHELRLVAG